MVTVDDYSNFWVVDYQEDSGKNCDQGTEGTFSKVWHT